MIIYNITVKVSSTIADEWINWQVNEHIPEIMETKLFTDYKVLKLLNEDEAEGPTYVTQLFADNMLNYDAYINDHAPRLRKTAISKWGDQFIAFRSLLETVH